MESFLALSLVAVALAAIVLGAVALALAGLLQYRLAALLTPHARVMTTLAVVAAGALLSVALTSRTLDDAQRDLANFVAYEDYATGFAASRWLSLLLIGAASIEAVRGWLAARRSCVPDPAFPVLWAMLAFYLGTLAIQAFAAENTGFRYKDLYVPIILVAVWCQRVERLDAVLQAAKWALFVLTAGSLAAALATPDFALHRPEPVLIPGIDWRLYGLTAHANTLGPAALLAVVIELHSPSRSRLWRGLQLAAAAVVLVLAQSRTSWVAALALVACVGVPLAMRPSDDPGRRALAFRRAAWTLIACLVTAIVLSVALFAFGDSEALLRRLALTTFNGRKEIWTITLQAWRENPLFGWGTEVWGVERQWQFRLFHVGHAHNQFVQTLGEAGLAGLALLCLYVGVLLRAAARRFAAANGLVLALLVILLTRFVTEAPMRAEGPLSWSVFLHILIIVATCHALRQPARAKTPAVAVRAAVAREPGEAAAAIGSLRTA